MLGFAVGILLRHPFLGQVITHCHILFQLKYLLFFLQYVHRLKNVDRNVFLLLLTPSEDLYNFANVKLNYGIEVCKRFLNSK